MISLRKLLEKIVNETLIDIVSAIVSVVDLIKDPSLENAGYLAMDVVAAAVPFAPGSYVAKGGKAAVNIADDVADAAKGAKKVESAGDVVKAAAKKSPKLSKKYCIKKAKLPTEGKVRFIPPKDWTPSQPLKKKNGGYLDKFGNVWVEGNSRTAGEFKEWDVQLSAKGRKQYGWICEEKNHLNVSLKGRVTHK